MWCGEKPLAMNTKESGELVQLAAERSLVNAVNHNIRMYPLVQQAHSLVQSGELGELFILQGSYLQDWLLLPPIGIGAWSLTWAARCAPWAISAPTGSI